MNSPVSRLLSKFFGDSERSTTLSKNIIGSLFLKGISIVVQLMLVPMTLTYLSKELYGIWLTISSVVLWLTFFDVGFSLGLKNRLAEAIARGNLERGRQLVSTTYVMLFAIFVPLGLICELIIPYFDWTKILNVDASYGPVLVVTMRILILSFVLQMIFNSISTILAAFQRVAFANAFTVLGNIISLIVIWLLIQFTEPSLINMALAISFVPVAVYIVSSLILFSGQLRAVRPSLLAFRKDAIGDIFSLGAKFFIIQIQLIIMQQATNLLISNISNPDFVAYYNIVYRYLGAAMMVFNLVLGPLWPAFTDAYTKGDYPWMRSTYRTLTRLYLFCLGAIIVMCVISPFAYSIWLGNAITIPWAMTISIATYFAILMWDSLQTNLLNGIGAVKLQSYVTCIGIVFHIPLSFLLGHYIGAYGVVVSLMLITFIYAACLTTQSDKILRKKATGIWAK